MRNANRLWTTAAAQHWLLSTAQLRAAGLSDAAIRHRIGTGRLFRARRGVFSVGRPASGFDPAALSALLSVGPAAVLSHAAAAYLWRLTERFSGPVDVTLPSQSGRAQRAGVRVHRCATLGKRDITHYRLIPVTTVARTLRDLAGDLEAEELRHAVRAAERLHGLDLPGLHELVAEPLTGAREARLRRLLETYMPAKLNPGLEEAFFEALVRHGLTLPLVQKRMGSRVPDFLWQEERLIVETDDRASHSGWLARTDDVARDREFAARGWLVLRFTWSEVQNRPAAVAGEVREILARRRDELGLPPIPDPPVDVTTARSRSGARRTRRPAPR